LSNEPSAGGNLKTNENLSFAPWAPQKKRVKAAMDGCMERKCDKDNRKVLHKKGKSLFVRSHLEKDILGISL
jgi:hypothetical protein